MNDNPMTTRVPARRGLGAALGAAALLAATASWAQDSRPATKDMRPKTSDRAAGAARGGAAPARAPGAADRDARADDDDLDPALAESLAQARRRVEVLEAQLEAKRARIELAEARLKRAQSQLASLKSQGDGSAAQEKIASLQADIPVLEAEHDVEVAEIREPEVLLKQARREVDDLERLARRPGLAARQRRGYGSADTNLMNMNYPVGMWNPMMGLGGYPMMGFARSRESEQLDELREMIENLRRDIDGLKRVPRP